MGTARRLIQRFEEQFEPDGAGYVYWAKPDRVGYAVSASERAAFMEAYARDVSRVTWLVNPWTFLAVSIGIVCLLSLRDFANEWIGLAVFLCVGGALLLVLHYAVETPDRRLALRPRRSPILSRADRRRRDAARTSWPKAFYEVAFAGLWVFIWTHPLRWESSFAWFSLALGAAGLTVALYGFGLKAFYAMQRTSRNGLPG